LSITVRLAALALAAFTLTLGTDRVVPRRAVAAEDQPAAVVVRARRADDLNRVAAYARSIGYAVTSQMDALPALRVVPPAGVTTADALTAFRARPGVEYAEPVYHMFRTADVPADPLYGQEAPYLSVEHAPEAWDIEKGKSGVIVAVLDTGIDLSHPDLQGRIWISTKETANNGVDDDHNGCIDDVNGCAFLNDVSPGCARSANGNVRDDLGHGTFVAGVIAAAGNGQGMVGVARGVTVLPVKVLDCQGDGDSLGLAEGIIYAAQAGAKIMNVSLGGPVDSAVVREAVRIAHDTYGALIVAAAGNGGTNGVAYPARYPHVLAVGAVSAADPAKRAPFSSYGPEIAVVAIGEGIIGTVPKPSCAAFLPCINGDPYAKGSGTSFSAPQVAGLAALMLSHRPALKPDSIIAAIEATADPLPDGGTPGWAGAGRINMAQALKPAFRLGAPGVTKN